MRQIRCLCELRAHQFQMRLCVLECCINQFITVNVTAVTLGSYYASWEGTHLYALEYLHRFKCSVHNNMQHLYSILTCCLSIHQITFVKQISIILCLLLIYFIHTSFFSSVGAQNSLQYHSPALQFIYTQQPYQADQTKSV